MKSPRWVGLARLGALLLAASVALPALPAPAARAAGTTTPPAPVYFAEGFTGTGFHEFLTLLNPGSSDQPVTIDYLLPEGNGPQQSLTIPAGSRSTVDVNNAVGPNRSVAARVTADPSVHAERVMYFNACPAGLCIQGHHEGPSLQPSSTWLFAEGFTGKGVAEWLTLLNPGTAAVSVSVRYTVGAGAAPLDRTYSVAPGARQTVNVNDVVGPEHEVSMAVTAASPIVAERPMYFNACFQATCANGGSVSGGVAAASTSWDFAEGYVGPGFTEFVTLQNPGASPATAQLVFLDTHGSTYRQTVPVPPLSRVTVRADETLAAGTSAGLHVGSDTPLVVERPMYWHACVQGVCADNGSATAGLQPAGDWYFPEGYTGAGYQEFVTVGNPSGQPATVNAELLFDSSQRQSYTITVPAYGRSTLDINAMAGAGRSVATHVSSNQPVVAERPVYFAGCLSAGLCVDFIPQSRLLPIAHQYMEHRLDCEATALQMIAGYRGATVTQNAILDMFGADLRSAVLDSSGHLQAWGNPYQYFVGSVDGYESNYTGYGIKYPPAVRAATQLRLSVLSAGDGIPAAELYRQVRLGHPSMVWISADYATHAGIHYTAFDGTPVFWGRGFEHVVVLAGVTDTSVALMDGLRGPGPTWTSRANFEAMLAQFSNMAVVVD